MYRQYTQCYQYTPGNKPFHIDDLPGFVLGVSFVGLITSILLAAAGNPVLAGFLFGVQYAAAIAAVADQWLYHRLVCVDKAKDPRCAVGTVERGPEIGDLGAFDNDEFFDIRLMPHAAFAEPPRAAGTDDKAWAAQVIAARQAYAEIVYADGFQGELLKPSFDGALAYDKGGNYYLHCEAEGNFWQAMKDYALLLGALAGVGAGLGAAGGAAAGCAIGGIFGPIGCAIGAIIGAILGLALGGAAGAGIGAAIAFNSSPGDVQDANVGDLKAEPITLGDKVIVLGHLVYDGFHEGWHEFHPLMAVMKLNKDAHEYLNADPDFPEDPEASEPFGLTPDDMRKGLASPAFRAKAEALRQRWCDAIRAALSAEVKLAQSREELAWAVHPDVDGCRPPSEPSPIR